MKKCLILILLLAIIISSSVTGCSSVVQTYTNPEQVIVVGANEEFIIALDANPTTGCSWQGTFDKDMVSLLEKSYKRGCFKK